MIVLWLRKYLQKHFAGLFTMRIGITTYCLYLTIFRSQVACPSVEYSKYSLLSILS